MAQKSKMFFLVIFLIAGALSLNGAVTKLYPGNHNVVLDDVRLIYFYLEHSECGDYLGMQFKMRLYDVTDGRFCYLSSWRTPPATQWCGYTFDVLNDTGRFKRGHKYNWLIRYQWEDTYDNQGPGRTDWQVIGSFIVANNAIVE